LKKRIAKCNRCGKNSFCPFPSFNGVKGFGGDRDYIFAAAQPTFGEFGTKGDRRLYRNMAKYGFEDAHLTDVVKCRGEKFKKLSEIETDNCIDWFDEEVRIVSPKAIIALGDKALGALMSKTNFQPVLGMTHYSARINDAEYEEEFKVLRQCLDSDTYQHGMKMERSYEAKEVHDTDSLFERMLEEIPNLGDDVRRYDLESRIRFERTGLGRGERRIVALVKNKNGITAHLPYNRTFKSKVSKMNLWSQAFSSDKRGFSYLKGIDNENKLKIAMDVIRIAYKSLI